MDTQGIGDAPSQPDRLFVPEFRPFHIMMHTPSSTVLRTHAQPPRDTHANAAGHARARFFAVRTFVRASTISWAQTTATCAGRSPGSRVIASGAPSRAFAQWSADRFRAHPAPSLAAYSCRDSHGLGRCPYHVPILIPSRGTGAVFPPGQAGRPTPSTDSRAG